MHGMGREWQEIQLMYDWDNINDKNALMNMKNNN